MPRGVNGQQPNRNRQTTQRRDEGQSPLGLHLSFLGDRQSAVDDDRLPGDVPGGR
jgi:hypothetical protein